MKKTSIFLLVAVLVMMTGIMTACQDDTGGITPDKPYTDGTYKSYGVGEFDVATREMKEGYVVLETEQKEIGGFLYPAAGATIIVFDGNEFTYTQTYTSGGKTIHNGKFEYNEGIITFFDNNGNPHPELQTSGSTGGVLYVLKDDTLIMAAVSENGYALGIVFKKQ